MGRGEGASRLSQGSSLGVSIPPLPSCLWKGAGDVSSSLGGFFAYTALPVVSTALFQLRNQLSTSLSLPKPIGLAFPERNPARAPRCFSPHVYIWVFSHSQLIRPPPPKRPAASIRPAFHPLAIKASLVSGSLLGRVSLPALCKTPPEPVR